MKRVFYLSLVMTVLFFPRSVFGQGSPPSPTPAPATLAVALASANAPTNGVALAVQAEQVAGSADTPPLEPHASMTQVGDAYGRLVRRFGSVTAVAPPTMVILNSQPGQPNIYADLQPSETAKLLAGSLSQSQWQALMSDHGLGFSDLTDDNQRQMFTALFPDGKLNIDTEDSDPSRQDLSQELPQARLRVAEKTMIFLPLQGDTNTSVSGNVPVQPGQAKQYRLARDYQPKTTEFGVPVRAEQTNALKPSDLNYASGALQTPVTLAGVKTVGDLVSRIAQQTHLELYCDPRYVSQSVTLVGNISSASASDLLRALSLCLTGTWRQVGPAFVLTYDQIGLGTIRQIWQTFEQEAQDLKQGPLGEAGDKIVTNHSPQDLNPFGDALAVTPDEMTAWKKDNPDNYFYSGTPYMSISLKQLTPAQQANVQAMNDEMTKHPSDFGHGPQLPDISGKVGIESMPSLQLLLPSLDGPVEMEQMSDLFQPSPKLQQEMWKKQQDANPKKPAPADAQPPSVLSQVMPTIPRRAIFAAPQTPADLASIVKTMKTFGFNQLWITVFSGGQSHPDLLVAALKETKGLGIAVFPVMNLLRWGLDAPSEAQDLTIVGETSAQMEQASQQQQNASNVASGQPPTPIVPPTSLLVTPCLPQVEHTLENFVHYYGAHPGIAGLVWTDTASLGYTNSENVPYRQQSLGYALSARLGFLRQYHSDPIDLGAGSQADTSMSNFGDYQIEDKLGKQWHQYLNTADHALLKQLYLTAEGRAVPVRILMANQNQDYGNPWYGSWDSLSAPIPTYHGWNDDMSSQQPRLPAIQAKSESKVALIPIPFGQVSTPDALAAQLTYLFKTDRWDGFVVDVGNGKDFAKFGNQKTIPPAPQTAK